MSSTNHKFHAIHNVSCLICLIWKPVWLWDFYSSWSTFRSCELVFTYTVWAGARLHGLRLWRQGGLLFQVIILLLAWYFLSNIPDSQGKLLFEFWQQLFNIGASSLHEILSMGIGIDSCVINRKHLKISRFKYLSNNIKSVFTHKTEHFQDGTLPLDFSPFKKMLYYWVRLVSYPTRWSLLFIFGFLYGSIYF